ncbi:MAG: hypothetical protein VX335_04930 [Pseudomonadota bacterium]|nr:hypothetical protein [Pseudomonadota bacterium]
MSFQLNFHLELKDKSTYLSFWIILVYTCAASIVFNIQVYLVIKFVLLAYLIKHALYELRIHTRRTHKKSLQVIKYSYKANWKLKLKDQTVFSAKLEKPIFIGANVIIIFFRAEITGNIHKAIITKWAVTPAEYHVLTYTLRNL